MGSWATRALLVILLIAGAAAMTCAIITSQSRPPVGIEGEILFEASRIREGRPLYIDPIAGTREYGEPPTRYYVLYPPLWSWLVSLLPESAALLGSRIIATLLWLGLICAIVTSARQSSRWVTGLGGLFIAGTYVLILYGSSGRPDSAALCLAGMGLLLSVKAGRSGLLAGVLFALAAWLKPHIIGLGAGAFLATLFIDRRAAGLTVLGALAVSAPIAFILQKASGGVWISHLVMSTAQPLVLSIWLDNLYSRLPFFAAFIGFAAWCGFHERSSINIRVALSALAASVFCTLLLLAKTGSASNYWMEPCVAALIVLSQSAASRLSPIVATVATLQALWVGIATVRSSLDDIENTPKQSAILAKARQICGIGQQDVVLADEPGFEFSLNNRVIATPYQFTHLVRSGMFPVEIWQNDLIRPDVRCLVVHTDILERPLSAVDIQTDLFPPRIREVLSQRFVRAAQDGGMHVYRLRNGTQSDAPKN